MKKLILLSVFVSSFAFADTCATKLMPAFTAEQAKTLCTNMGALNKSLTPAADNTYDLGSSSLEWKDVYAQGKISITGSTSGFFWGATSANADVRSVAGDPPLYLFSNPSSTGFPVIHSFGANNGGQQLQFYKTRSTAGDANTIVQSGDAVGSLVGLGADGADYRVAARINLAVDGTPGASDMPGSIDFLTTPDGSATPASVLKLSQDKSALFTGAVTSSSTGSLGWSYVTGTNTACTTTCTSAAVFGVDLAAGASQPVIVGPAAATADACVCAGAS